MSLHNFLSISSYDNYEDDRNDFNEDSRNTNFDQNHNFDSEEDTEEASETEFGLHQHQRNDEPMEIKEQMYQDKLANLKKQLEDLKNGVHPEYVKRVKKLEHQYKERIRLNEIYRDYLRECVERDYIIENKAAIKEYEEKKADLKENLLTDFEDRRKLIESERHSMELTNDSMEVIKPTVTRKLRRRPNEPPPVVEKRRKPTTGQLVVYLLDEKEIENDLKQITRGKALTPNNDLSALVTNGISSHNNNHSLLSDTTPALVETRIEDGKLLYERRWFHRGQPVYIEGKDMARFAATISAIGNEVVWVKKVTDNNKVKINMAQLAKGKVAIKRRAN